jgi:hypothetical protein
MRPARVQQRAGLAAPQVRAGGAVQAHALGAASIQADAPVLGDGGVRCAMRGALSAHAMAPTTGVVRGPPQAVRRARRVDAAGLPRCITRSATCWHAARYARRNSGDQPSPANAASSRSAAWRTLRPSAVRKTTAMTPETADLTSGRMTANPFVAQQRGAINPDQLGPNPMPVIGAQVPALHDAACRQLNRGTVVSRNPATPRAPIADNRLLDVDPFGQRPNPACNLDCPGQCIHAGHYHARDYSCQTRL